ncbi:glycine-rich cell wall structural protein 1.0-like [Solanum dulcamara]|uniref:glycine-rich cell wall structural protein 1.0-like n=1 Tax=Solanum dulcamara TaxID=45834 RepID=UPI002485724D|nr:glycine-rich cell wall structural protein 1.0-like [Solanum dulcamara]
MPFLYRFGCSLSGTTMDIVFVYARLGSGPGSVYGLSACPMDPSGQCITEMYEEVTWVPHSRPGAGKEGADEGDSGGGVGGDGGGGGGRGGGQGGGDDDYGKRGIGGGGGVRGGGDCGSGKGEGANDG